MVSLNGCLKVVHLLTASAEESANALLMHFGRYGAPSVLLSDRCSHFVNSVTSEFLLHVGTEHTLTIAYSKQENSIVERANKEINRHLAALFFDQKMFIYGENVFL